MKENNKMIVAMSGGLDSSIAALMMKKEGYDLTGIFMRLNDSYEEAERAARLVCRQIGIKFYPVDLSHKFKSEIVDYFLDSYASGLTPNPCVKCNLKIKFKELIRVADELGAYWLATGHYVKKEHRNKSFHLYRPSDNEKDQTYFLYNLNQDILKRVKFPLFESRKSEIKKMAEKVKLPYLKKESQDICFLSKEGKMIDHNEFLQKKLKFTEGDIKLLSGKIIGRHKGLPLYTIGQRRGIDIGGTGPYYAVKMDYEKNELIVTNDPEDPALYSKTLKLKNINWISGMAPKMPFECESVIRYRHKPVKSEVFNMGDHFEVKFKSPQRAAASGQSAVFYDNDELLGGGIII
jgi:tRNA-uridine 2-sulfurtransferase